MYPYPKKSPFVRYLEAKSHCKNDEEIYQYQREQFKEEYYKRLEREQLVQEITDKVLSKLSTTIDLSEAIKKIEELNKVINNLEKK